jgi:hypothetical protein
VFHQLKYLWFEFRAVPSVSDPQSTEGKQLSDIITNGITEAGIGTQTSTPMIRSFHAVSANRVPQVNDDAVDLVPLATIVTHRLPPGINGFSLDPIAFAGRVSRSWSLAGIVWGKYPPGPATSRFLKARLGGFGYEASKNFNENDSPCVPAE